MTFKWLHTIFPNLEIDTSLILLNLTVSIPLIVLIQNLFFILFYEILFTTLFPSFSQRVKCVCVHIQKAMSYNSTFDQQCVAVEELVKL